MAQETQTIVLGGGCFWCFDATFKLVRGITSVEEGYSGGHVANPTDDDIYAQTSGHAEVVRLTYDPAVIALEDILEMFWALHDPTTPNRQGHDVGPQYRSIVFYANDQEKQLIEAAKQKAQAVWDDPIVTEVKPFEVFYPAAEYHKNYEANRPDYCQIVINPKLSKLRQTFASRLK